LEGVIFNYYLEDLKHVIVARGPVKNHKTVLQEVDFTVHYRDGIEGLKAYGLTVYH
jgi:hypothetical protein